MPSTSRHAARRCPALLAALLACSPREPAATATTTTAATAGPTTTTTAPSTGSTTTSTTTGTSTTTTGTSTGAPTSAGSGDTASFAVMPDLPPPVACDPWDDTCPRGQKCKPIYWGGWTAVCADIDARPAGLGEPCDKPEATPFDDCPDDSMCFGWHQEGDSLRCTPLCEGTPDAPSCADVCSPCLRFQDQFVGLCPVRCDPLAPECPENQTCSILVFQPHFYCFSKPFPATVGAGETCYQPNHCDPGMACLQADMLPSCEGDRCCTPVCDTGQADTCGAAYPGTVCAPWPTLNPEFNFECLSPGLGLCTAA